MIRCGKYPEIIEDWTLIEFYSKVFKIEKSLDQFKIPHIKVSITKFMTKPHTSKTASIIQKPSTPKGQKGKIMKNNSFC
jgi:hypothetical protein